MKKILSPALLLIWSCIFAQEPAGYYNTATSSGYTLKSQLHEIIDGHNNRGYSAVWDFISDYELDTYYENDGTVLDIYSENPLGSDPYNFVKITNQCGSSGSQEGDCYNREHSFPKSWFNDGQPMFNDIHHLFPTDKIVNGQRSNHPFGEVGSTTFTSQNSSKVGSARSGLGYSGTVFEPIDEFKGDLARAYFYMATRYEDVLSSWSSTMLDGSSDQVYEDWALEMLINWHITDPVSQKEIDRNNNAQTFQGNRNPFVDHPEWVNSIWGDGTPILTISDQSSIDFGNIASGTNSTSQSYTISGANLSTDVSVTVATPFELSLNQSNWSSSITVSQVNAENATNNTVYVRFSPTVANGNSYSESISHSSTGALAISKLVSGSELTIPSSSGGGAGDLFFSEYIEGSNNNKALEIYNGTDRNIDMAGYSIERYNNGLTTPASNGIINLSGILNAGEVYVIANSASFQELLDKTDITSEITFFNGNDAIGLYKNETLIDLIGVIGIDPGSAWSSGNHTTGEKTLVRKANIYKGNPNGFSDISKLTDEWDVYAQNTFSFIGNHSFTTPTFTWTGTSNQDWSNVANWQNNEIAYSNANVIIGTASNQPVIGTDIKVNNLTIASRATLTVASGASLAIMGSYSGSGQLIAKRNTVGDNGYSIIGSPVSDASILSLSASFIYDYNGSNFFAPTGDLLAGKGYFVSYNDPNPEVSFIGVPSTGNISIDVTNDGDGFNIVSNPYTASIDRQKFIFENANDLDGNIWLWDDGGKNEGNIRGGDYIVVNNMGQTFATNTPATGLIGASAFNGKIGSMQGFFVKTNTGGKANFKPEMQSVVAQDNADNHFYRQQRNEPEIIRLSLSGNDLYNEIIIGFDESATEGHDFGLDAEKFSGNELISFYSTQQEVKYAIQALPSSTVYEKEIMLGMDIAEVGTYSIGLAENLISESLDVLLYDKIKDNYINLNAKREYKFYSDNVIESDRFSLFLISKNITSLTPPDKLDFEINIQANRITFLADLDGFKALYIHTIDGRVIAYRQIEFKDNHANIDLFLNRNQLYVISLAGKTKKIVIQ